MKLRLSKHKVDADAPQPSHQFDSTNFHSVLMIWHDFGGFPVLSNGSNLKSECSFDGAGGCPLCSLSFGWRDPVLSNLAQASRNSKRNKPHRCDELKERCRRSNRGALIPTGISTHLRETTTTIIIYMEERRRGKGA